MPLLPPSPPPLDAWLQQAMAHHTRGELPQALRLYEAILRHAPRHFDALHLRGVALLQSGQAQAARGLIEQALRVNDGVADAHYHLGMCLDQLGQPAAAVDSYTRAIERQPQAAKYHNNRAKSLCDLGRAAEALADADRALALQPQYPLALNTRGNALRELGRLDEAEQSYRRSLALQPQQAQALCNLGAVLHLQKRWAEAIDAFNTALALQPDHAESLSNRGNTWRELHRADEALRDYERALALRPDFAQAWANRGAVLHDLRRHAEALECQARTLQLRPGDAQALINRGVTLNELRRFDEAVAAYEEVLRGQPRHAEALFRLGDTLRETGRYAQAAEVFGRLLDVDPDHELALGFKVHCRLHDCDWRDLAQDRDRLKRAIREGRLADTPFSFLAASDDAADQRRCAEGYAQARHPAALPPVCATPRPAGARIRLAYISADLHEHATAHLMAELFELHDRERFELWACSYGPDTQDAMRQRLRRAFDHFVDVRGMDDRRVATWLNEAGIDIAVDLKGYTAGARPGILAWRAAPVQVSYLGYPGTLGAPYIDYVIADRWVVPPEHEAGFTECVVRLPHSYQVNDRRRAIAARTPARSELGLPEHGFVFACFNNNYKITPEVFSVWMRLLQAVPDSVLWLYQASDCAAQHLRAHAQEHGVPAQRLVFAPRLPGAEHLARLPQADLFLDTSPYGAHTTASDALWAGLPVLTWAGGAFAARVAASLLSAAGLPELITTSLAEYEARALALARERQSLQALRARLAGDRRQLPLFDTPRYCSHLERAYLTMHERARVGLPPQGFDVAPD